MLSHALGNEQEAWPLMRMVPSLDLSETDEAVEVRVDLPGMDAKDIDEQLNQNMLRSRGTKSSQQWLLGGLRRTASNSVTALAFLGWQAHAADVPIA